jgi:hypothetical protein
MADFFSGLQAAQQQGLGQLQQAAAFEGLRAQKIQRQKQERIQGVLGGLEGATPQQSRAAETEMMALDPQTAAQMRSFRTEGEAETASRIGEFAAVARPAIGTPEEPQAMLWLAQQAEQAGVPRETIQQALTSYSQNPESAPLIVDSMLARALGAKDFLAREASPKDIRLAEIKAGSTSRNVKISDIMQDYPGMSKRDARDIVDGRIKVTTDPLTGEVNLTNLATGKARKATGVSAPAAPTPPELTVDAPVLPIADASQPTETLFDVVGAGVGAIPVAKEIMSTTLGQISPGLTFSETTKARTKIKGVREALISALAKSGKPPLAEQERLLDLLPSTGIFESPEHAADQLTELYGLLGRQIIEDLAVSNDPSMAKKVREESAMRAQETKNVLRELGTPPTPEENIPTINTQEEYDALPSGASFLTKSGKSWEKP